MDRADEGHGTVVVERGETDDLKIRKLFVQVDDLPAEPLDFGRTFRMTLASGRHHMKVSNGLAVQELDFEMSAGEEVTFKATNLFVDRVIAPFLFILGGSVLAKVRLVRSSA